VFFSEARLQLDPGVPKDPKKKRVFERWSKWAGMAATGADVTREKKRYNFGPIFESDPAKRHRRRTAFHIEKRYDDPLLVRGHISTFYEKIRPQS
jgi:hypothetical protein